MPKKSVRDMNVYERMHHSLNFKVMRTIVFMSVVIAVVTIFYGFTLYLYAVRKEYKNAAYELAGTASAVVTQLAVQQYSKRTLKVYSEMTEEERLAQDSESYREAYDTIEDYGYGLQADKLALLQKYNNANSVYIAAIDTEHMRMIYVIDSDSSETHCPPGKWEDVSQEEVDVYFGNTVISWMEQYIGTNESGNAFIDHNPEYGYICTAGVIMMDVDGYAVGAFVDLDMSKTVNVSISFLWQYAIILIILIVIIAIITSKHVRKTIVKPINNLADAAIAYSNDKRDGVNADNHFRDLNIRTGDEIENLSLIMNDMENDLNSYVEHLTAVTAERERMSTELDVAKTIQKGVVPHNWPAFPDRTEFDIFAAMHTAKEVGGDFYDFFMVEEDLLAIVIADVSGKGIPAALFMMAVKNLIHNIAVFVKESPAEILRLVNERISLSNQADMFVTVWLGITDLSTGKVVASNAGHEYPVLRRANGDFEVFREPHAPAVGVMDGIKYRNYEFDLAPGDELFLYTDGVPEATNIENTLYSIDRMLVCLNNNKDSICPELLDALKKDIDEFAGDAPQFDDITMISFKYYGTEKE